MFRCLYSVVCSLDGIIVDYLSEQFEYVEANFYSIPMLHVCIEIPLHSGVHIFRIKKNTKIYPHAKLETQI